MKKIIILFLLLIQVVFVFSQKRKSDSLLYLLGSAKEDTNRVLILNNLAKKIINSNPDSSIKLSLTALELARILNYNRGIVQSNYYLGAFYNMTSNYPRALNYLLEGLKMVERINDDNQIAGILRSIGTNYGERKEYYKAIDYFIKALKYDENGKDTTNISKDIANIGVCYKELGTINSSIKNKSDSLHYIALEYYFRALKLDEKISRISGIANNLGTIGVVYAELAEKENATKLKDSLYEIAAEYYQKALQIDSARNYRYGIAVHYGNIGSMMISKKQYLDALKNLKRALAISEEDTYDDLLIEINSNLSYTYEQLGEYKNSFRHYRNSVKIRDSIYNEENTKQIVASQLNYEFEKKEALTKAEQDKKDAIVSEEKRRTNLFLLLIGAIATAVAIIAGIIFRSLRITRKQKRIIEVQKKEVETQKAQVEKQKHTIEEKNKDITDSINYARRLQEAILPPQKFWQQQLPNSFVLYKPKDIIAGDFFWMEKLSDSILFSAGDCTGHGIPGCLY